MTSPMAVVDYEAENTASADPILFSTPLPLRAMFYPLGFPLELATNSEEVLACAKESWSPFTKQFTKAPVRLHFGVTNGGHTAQLSSPVCRRRAHLLTTMADAENFTVADLQSGFAFGWMTERTISDRAYVRYHFIEAAALVLLASKHLIPLHAACVSYHGRGVLLCGNSGAGKSSLAFACARAGFDFTSDDASYLLRGGDCRSVVGNVHQMRFRESAKVLFPELAGQPVTPRFSGKLAIEVPTARIEGVRVRPECAIDQIVFLDRQPNGPYGLASASASRALSYFKANLFRDAGAAREEDICLERLLSAPVSTLYYSDLDWAVERLRQLLSDPHEIANGRQS